jgi:subtilisin family serine protease
VNPSINPPEDRYPGFGVPETMLGLILQRGGEELLLQKESDRFTIHLNDYAPRNWQRRIQGTWCRQISHVALHEIQVKPQELDAAMSRCRQFDWVEFASHIYQCVENPETLVYLTDEITLHFGDVPEATREQIVETEKLILVRPVAGMENTFIFRVTPQSPGNPIKIANRLAGQSEVLSAEPNIILHSQQLYRPQDTLYHKQWYLQNNGNAKQLAQGSHIDAQRAWDYTRGLRSITVAIADDSIDLNHPDFQGMGKIVAPRDFRERDFVPLPGETSDNHGTACAGVAVAEETGTGIVGVAPGCALMPLRTSGYLDDNSIEQLFEWAMEKGADVIACSWGASAVHFPLSDRQRAVIHRAATEGRDGKGCVVIFAAGNANRPVNGTINESGWPNKALKGSTKWLNGYAVHPDTIAVSACTSLNKKAAYSNWGNSISVCAPSNNAPPGLWLQSTGYVQTPPQINTWLPGLGVFTADRVGSAGYDTGDFTGTFGGTSSACPVVAGVAALILSVNPDLTAREVKQILQETTDKIEDAEPDPQLGTRMGKYDSQGHCQWFGYGKVNAYKAVQKASQRHVQRLHVSRQVRAANRQKMDIADYQGESARGFSLLSLFRQQQRMGTTSKVSVSESSPVRDVQVFVDIKHDFLGDLDIFLIAPDETTVLLQGRTLGSQKILSKTYSLQNTPTLKKVLHKSAQGDWQLWIVDRAAGDTGQLHGWHLQLGV